MVMPLLRDVRWVPILELRLLDLPLHGNAAGAYILRDATTHDLLYIGSTDRLRRRLFGNHIGGVGGSTTQRVHGLLFTDGHASNIEVAWLTAMDYRGLEQDLKDEYRALGGSYLPQWTKR